MQCGVHRVVTRRFDRLDVFRPDEAELGQVPAAAVPGRGAAHHVERVAVLGGRAVVADLDADAAFGARPAAGVEQAEVVTQLVGDDFHPEVPVDHQPVGVETGDAEPAAGALQALKGEHVDQVLVAAEVDPGVRRGFVGLAPPFAVRTAGGRGVEVEPAEHVAVFAQLAAQGDRAVGLLFVEGVDRAGPAEDLRARRFLRPGPAGFTAEVDQQDRRLARPRRNRRGLARRRRLDRADEPVVAHLARDGDPIARFRRQLGRPQHGPLRPGPQRVPRGLLATAKVVGHGRVERARAGDRRLRGRAEGEGDRGGNASRDRGGPHLPGPVD